MDLLKALGILVGRACISFVFLWAGIAKMLNWQASNLFMESREVPYLAFLLPIAIFLQSAGGLSLLLGYCTRVGVMLLLAFLIPATFLFHDFWNLEGVERLTQQVIFTKDIAILGGLFYVLAHGPGPLSLDFLFHENQKLDS